MTLFFFVALLNSCFLTLCIFLNMQIFFYLADFVFYCIYRSTSFVFLMTALCSILWMCCELFNQFLSNGLELFSTVLHWAWIWYILLTKCPHRLVQFDFGRWNQIASLMMGLLTLEPTLKCTFPSFLPSWQHHWVFQYHGWGKWYLTYYMYSLNYE